MKTMISLIFILGLFVTTSNAATVSGDITNSYGYPLDDLDISATQVGNPSNVVFTTVEYGGHYSIALGDGTWLLTINSDQLLAFGYQPCSIELEISGQEFIVANLCPRPIEPPTPPHIELNDLVNGRFDLLLIVS